MFCEQCEQTASGNGCHQWGACGKSPQVNAVQDLLVYCLRGAAPVVLRAKELGIDTRECDRFTCESLFATMTNVNFDQNRFTKYIKKASALRENLKSQIQQATDTPTHASPRTLCGCDGAKPDRNYYAEFVDFI